MRVPGVRTAKTFSRWIRARLLGGALILGYHRIVDNSPDSQGLCVSTQNFAEHLEILSKYACPISLGGLVRRLRDGLLPARSVAVTFDDGYVDNLYEAKPLLEKHSIPATIFVCIGYAGREFWWDELERLVISSHRDLGALSLRLDTRKFGLPQALLRPETDGAQDLSSRRQFCDSLYQFLIPLDIEERESAMSAIRSWAGTGTLGSSIGRALCHGELIQLAEGGLVELGAHTRNHAMLPRLSPQRQAEEILSGKQELEALLGAPVLGFSYPNGQGTAVAKVIVREAGFAYACTSLRDVVRSQCDMYELGRFWQQDVDGDDFLRSLKSWGAL